MKGSTSRKPKTSKASTSSPQLDQIPPTFYTDVEAALEAGTELEEKAERFAIGWKAEKYFEKSLALYQRAVTLDKNGQDAPYNCARVLFLLATGFYSPPKSIEALHQSVTLYRQSLSLTSPTETSDGDPSAFYLDVQFNLAVTLLALADQLEQSKDSVVTRADIINEAIIQFNSVINGQEMVLHEQKMEEEMAGKGGEGEDTEPSTLMSPEMEEESMSETREDAQTRSEYTTSLITPASALETLYNLHLSAIALLDVVAEENLIQSALQLSSTSLQRAQAIFVSFPDGEKRSPDNEWNEVASSLRFAPLEIKVAEVAKMTTLGQRDWASVERLLASCSEEATREANTLLVQSDQQMDLSTTIGRSKHRIHSQHLEQLGDSLLTLARTFLFYMYNLRKIKEGGTDITASLSQQAWNLLGLSSKLYLSTLKSLDTSAAGAGSSAVLGTSNASTATTRRRCSLYTSMSTLSFLRSDIIFFQTVAGLQKKTREQLVNNGRVYARKAVTEIGLGWLLNAGNSLKSHYELPHGGLDSLRGEVDAILTLLRSLHLRSVVLDSTVDNMQEAQVVCANVKHTLLQGTYRSTWNWLLFYPDEQTQGAGLLDQVVGEEGDAAITPEERAFWSQIESQLQQ